MQFENLSNKKIHKDLINLNYRYVSNTSNFWLIVTFQLMSAVKQLHRPLHTMVASYQKIQDASVPHRIEKSKYRIQWQILYLCFREGILLILIISVHCWLILYSYSTEWSNIIRESWRWTTEAGYRTASSCNIFPSYTHQL